VVASDEGVEEREGSSEWWRAKALARWRQRRRGIGVGLLLQPPLFLDVRGCGQVVGKGVGAYRGRQCGLAAREDEVMTVRAEMATETMTSVEVAHQGPSDTYPPRPAEDIIRGVLV
jgi:hypothetical protein